MRVPWIVWPVQERRRDALEVRQPRVVDAANEALTDQHLQRVVRRADHVVRGIPGLQLRQQRLVGVIQVDVDLHTVSLLELGECLWRNVIGPDEQIELAIAIAGGAAHHKERRRQHGQADHRRQGRRPDRSALFEQERRDQQETGRENQHGRHRVDLRRDPTLEHRIDLQRQRRRTHTGDEGRDNVVVDRQRKGEQTAREDGRCDSPAVSPAGTSGRARRRDPSPLLRACDRTRRCVP